MQPAKANAAHLIIGMCHPDRVQRVSRRQVGAEKPYWISPWAISTLLCDQSLIAESSSKSLFLATAAITGNLNVLAVKHQQTYTMSAKRSRAAFESDNGAPQHAPFAIYGTPLPAYDSEVRDDGSYVPPWKQEVLDEHGRKRLHGAFTGGWSAGYFNTVGSKEGWTPQTFVSSRSNRAKKPDAKEAQSIEDFMDEEDLAEREEQRKLETMGSFAGLGEAGAAGNGGKGMFGDLFRADGETMGVKLLQRMGWRRGQGVGPKVRRRAVGDKTGETHLFAPENSKMISFDRKDDRKGLGFAGETKLSSTVGDPTDAKDDDEGDSEQDARILQTNRSKLLSKPKRLKKSGFGVGVLNDNGSDDEDPYTMGPQINYNRIIGGDKKKKKGGLTASNAATNVQKPVFTSKKITQSTSGLPNSRGFRKCHDGRLPLEGFILATASLTLQEENKYPPPSVPEGWKAAQVHGNGSETTYVSTADAAKASTLDPNSRASLLGETALPGKSVFDFLSPAARDKLALASKNSTLPQGKGEGAPAGYTPSEAEQRRTLWDLVPDLDRATAEAALARGKSGWMPYAEDEGKRARYRYFLELKAGQQSHLPSRPQGFATEEWGREMREFAQAAAVFKPVSGLMASRFTSSASSSPRLASDAPDPSGGKKDEDDPAEKAAKMEMFGPLTRSRHAFFPTRLLCKRFGVKPPSSVAGDHPDGDGGGGGGGDAGSKSLELVSQSSINRMMADASWQQSGREAFVSGGTEGGDEGGGKQQEAEVEVVDAERNAALEGQKAGEAVFRSIFGDEDSSSGGE